MRRCQPASRRTDQSECSQANHKSSHGADGGLLGSPIVSQPWDRVALLALGITIALTVFGYVTAVLWVLPGIYHERIPALAGLLGSKDTIPYEVYAGLLSRYCVRLLSGQLLVLLLLLVHVGRVSPDSGSRQTRLGLVIAFVVVVAAFGWASDDAAISFRGDANEYFLMNESLFNHGTPDLRPSDIATFSEAAIQSGTVGFSPYAGFFQSPVNNRFYSVHFWLYPILALPARAALGLVGASPLRAYELTNLILFAVSAVSVLLLARLGIRRRTVLLGLYVFSGVAWYVGWPSPEVFCMTLVVLALVLLTRERLAAAAVLVALASTQAPPLIVLLAAICWMAMQRAIRERKPAYALRVALAAAPALLPFAFYAYTFRTANLVVAQGNSSLSRISLARPISLMLDLNQGLLVYATPLLIALAATAVHAAKRPTQAREPLLFGGIAIGIMLVASTNIMWSMDVAGIIRYAVWLVPILLWAAVVATPWERPRMAVFGATLVIAQFALNSMWLYPPASTQHTPIARLALAHLPAIYSPEKDIFVDRSRGGRAPLPEISPVVFTLDDSVTKVLVASSQLDSLRNHMEVDDWGSVRVSRGDRDGYVYLDLRSGTARLIEQEDVISSEGHRVSATLGGPSPYGPTFDAFGDAGVTNTLRFSLAPYTRYPVYIEIVNDGPTTWYPGGRNRLLVLIDILDDERRLRVSRDTMAAVDRAVIPGQHTRVYARVTTPDVPGNYILDVRFVQEDESGRLTPLGRLADPIPVEVTPSPVPPIRR
jgi:hypothetical protein